MAEREVELSSTEPIKRYLGFVAYKLKVDPDDFRVYELSSLLPSPKAINGEKHPPYRLLRLEKRGWNTTDLLDRIARSKRIPFSAIGYGGRKDRHAVTVQQITVESRHAAPFERPIVPDSGFDSAEGDYRIEPLGWCGRPMTAELIDGNRFDLTLRSVHRQEIGIIEKNLARIRRHGFVNYFDSQRFGSFDTRSGELAAARLLRGDRRGYIEQTLCSVQSGDSSRLRERKRRLAAFLEAADWRGFLAGAVTGNEKRVGKALIVGKGDFDAAVAAISADELSIQFAALQSWIFNEMVSARLAGFCAEHSIEGGYVKSAAQELFFPCSSAEILSEVTRHFSEPTFVPSAATRYESDSESRLFEAALAKLDLSREKLAAAAAGRSSGGAKLNAWLGEHKRSPWTVAEALPEPLRLLGHELDDRYSGRRKLRLSFALPRGNYATMLVKQATLRLRSD